MGRLAHNKAVQNRRKRNQDHDAEAAFSWDGFARCVDVATGHIDDLSVSDAMNWAEEVDGELKDEIDQMAVHERGGDGIGYAKVKDGEIIGYTIYSQYKR